MAMDPDYEGKWLVLTKIGNGELVCSECAKYNWPYAWIKKAKFTNVN